MTLHAFVIKEVGAKEIKEKESYQERVKKKVHAMYVIQFSYVPGQLGALR